VNPPNINFAIAFSGYADVDNAMNASNDFFNILPGNTFISIGGGLSPAGYFTDSILTNLNNAIASGELGAYCGICYDIEIGDSGLANSFANSFALARSKGFQVLVTVSHSAPYAISDAATLMASFFTSSDIEILSPQLYSSGTETANDYTATAGVDWAAWVGAKPTIVPSLVSYTFYNDAQAYFAAFSITTEGNIQWLQA
jgi:hypothetical protein